MEQCTDVDALMKLNEQMANTLNIAEQKDLKNYSPAISRVIDYIYHGKNKTLTLNQLASLVNLTPKYLSALFYPIKFLLRHRNLAHSKAVSGN